MKLPFTQEQFLEVFARYNAAVWPAPLILGALALAATYLACRRSRHSDRMISGILATLWLWAGIVYHLGFFTGINLSARWSGGLFIAQAALFLSVGTIAKRLTFRVPRGCSALFGGLLVAYSLFIYPLLNFHFGHGWPKMPTFGAPCPITIFTLGLLLWTNLRASAYLAMIPVMWAIAGTTAAFALGVYEDSVLAFAAAIAVTKIISRRQYSTATSSVRAMGASHSTHSPAPPTQGAPCYEK